MFGKEVPCKEERLNVNNADSLIGLSFIEGIPDSFFQLFVLIDLAIFLFRRDLHVV
jgi:hypothetical protein